MIACRVLDSGGLRKPNLVDIDEEFLYSKWRFRF